MTANRFSLIAFEDQDTDTFEELVASPASHGRAPSKKVSQKSLPIANVPGKSSLEKVSNLLILKKQQEQEEIARAAARAAEVERRAQEETVAAATANIQIEQAYRRKGKPNHHSRHEEKGREEMSSRQREHAYGRERRQTYRATGEKKKGAGKGNWGKLGECEVNSLAAILDAPRTSFVEEETTEVPQLEAVVPPSNTTSPVPASPAAVPVESPKPAEPAILTYEQYLAEKARTALVLDTPRREINCGVDNSTWKKAVPLKKEETCYNFVGKKVIEQSTHKPRPLATSIPSLQVDPRLNIDFSKPSSNVNKPKRPFTSNSGFKKPQSAMSKPVTTATADSRS